MTDSQILIKAKENIKKQNLHETTYFLTGHLSQKEINSITFILNLLDIHQTMSLMPCNHKKGSNSIGINLGYNVIGELCYSVNSDAKRIADKKKVNTIRELNYHDFIKENQDVVKDFFNIA